LVFEGQNYSKTLKSSHSITTKQTYSTVTVVLFVNSHEPPFFNESCSQIHHSLMTHLDTLN